MRYLSLKEVILLHKYAIKQSGGVVGIRDIGLLQSAITQPKAKFSGKDLYPTLIEKASALCFFLVKNHPFFDGNKRVGHLALETFLVMNGYEIVCLVDDQEKVIIDLAAGNMSKEELSIWLKSKIRKVIK